MGYCYQMGDSYTSPRLVLHADICNQLNQSYSITNIRRTIVYVSTEYSKLPVLNGFFSPENNLVKPIRQPIYGE